MHKRPPRVRHLLIGALLAVAPAVRCLADAGSGGLPPLATQPASDQSIATGSISTQPTLEVHEFKFEGNTVYRTDQLDALAKPYLDRPIAVGDLENLRLALTHLYVDHGYINSGAVLPDQTVKGGVLTFKIVEGKLGHVALGFLDSNGKTTNRHLLRRQYILGRIHYAADGVLNVFSLKDALELLRENVNVKSVNAELKPGATPGNSILNLDVHEANPIQLGLEYSNRRPPSVGESAFDALVSDTDLTGNSDDLEVRYDIANGPIDDPRLDGADDLGVDYILPISPSDTTLAFDYTRTSTLVVESELESLDIRSESNSYSFTLRQPLYRRPVAEPGVPALEIGAFVSGAFRDNMTRLNGEPFSFSPGAQNGTSRVTVLSFGQDISLRGFRDALSARSTFNIGVPWLDATSDVDGEAGGTFFSWLGQAQYTHVVSQIGPWKTNDWQFVARASGQVADRSLVTLEQFVIGGVETVRGYPENEVVTDNGVVGSVETHIPVIQQQDRDVLQLVPFVDVGYGENAHRPSSAAKLLSSAGIGFLYNPSSHLNAYLYYGIPFNSFPRTHNNAQDYGFHFGVTVFAF
jgi:hemolysin activation/secretion protein